MTADSTTKEIKDRLAAYTAMLRRIDNNIERIERMEATMTSPKAQQLDAMPHSGGPAGDRMADMIARKEELEQKAREAIAEERAEHDALAAMVDQLPKPDESAVVEMRYFDRMSWPDVCEALFGDRVDYIEKYDSYMRRTLRIHGAALVGLAELNRAAQSPGA